MAAPQRRYRAPVPMEPAARPTWRKGPLRLPDAAARKRQAGRRRRFSLLVVVPVLLMLGSVYLHTVSAGLGSRLAYLEERVASAAAEGERLEVRVAELSSAERVRPLAEEKLGMRDPQGADLRVYGSAGEDGGQSGGEAKGGEPR
jgi:nucleotide-binding universal stress UspA family protein